MLYAVRADLEARFGANEIDRLADTGEGGAARLDAALADAAAAMDSVLAQAFDVPLPGGPYPLPAGLACDLARERLYDDKAPEEVTRRADQARAVLADLAQGKTVLIDAAGNRVRPRPAGARANGPAPAMTEQALRGL